MDTLLSKVASTHRLTKGGGLDDTPASGRTHAAGEEGKHALRGLSASSRSDALLSALKREGHPIPDNFRELSPVEKTRLLMVAYGDRDRLTRANEALGHPGEGDQPNRDDLDVKSLPEDDVRKYEGTKARQTDTSKCFYCDSEATFHSSWGDGTADRWTCTYHEARNAKWRKSVGLEYRAERKPI